MRSSIISIRSFVAKSLSSSSSSSSSSSRKGGLRVLSKQKRFASGNGGICESTFLSSLFLFSVGLYCLGFLVEGTFFGEEDEEEEEEEEEDVGVELEQKTRTKNKQFASPLISSTKKTQEKSDKNRGALTTRKSKSAPEKTHSWRWWWWRRVFSSRRRRRRRTTTTTMARNQEKANVRFDDSSLSFFFFLSRGLFP